MQSFKKFWTTIFPNSSHAGNAAEIASDITEHLPFFLSQGQRAKISDQLQPASLENLPYFEYHNENALLQGDGMGGLIFFSFEKNHCETVGGIILSNSCDISADNKRLETPHITFAPVISASAYKTKLLAAGMKEQDVENKFSDMRKQKVTNLFWLPKQGKLQDEYIALLSHTYSMPYYALKKEIKDKMFTLSQAAFYLFLLKINIHFCRFDENIARFAD